MVLNSTNKRNESFDRQYCSLQQVGFHTTATLFKLHMPIIVTATVTVITVAVRYSCYYDCYCHCHHDYCCGQYCSQQLVWMVDWPAGLFAVGRRAQLSAPEDLLGSHMPGTPILTQKGHPEHSKIVCSTTPDCSTWLYVHLNLHLLDTPCLFHILGMRYCVKVLCMTKSVCKCPDHGKLPNIISGRRWLQASIYKNGATNADNAGNALALGC